MNSIPMPSVDFLPIKTKFYKPGWPVFILANRRYIFQYLRQLFVVILKRSWANIHGYWNKFTKPRTFKLNKNYIIDLPVYIFPEKYLDTTDKKKGYVTIVVKKPLKFDGASIPFFLWPLMYPIGILLIAGTLHDDGYKNNKLWRLLNGKIVPFMQGAGQRAFDSVFRKVAIYTNGLAFLCWLAWSGLGVGGFVAWKKHRRNELLKIGKGEKNK